MNTIKKVKELTDEILNNLSLLDELEKVLYLADVIVEITKANQDKWSPVLLNPLLPSEYIALSSELCNKFKILETQGYTELSSFMGNYEWTFGFYLDEDVQRDDITIQELFHKAADCLIKDLTE